MIKNKCFISLLLCSMIIAAKASEKGKVTMQDVVFREYDIRGKVDTELVLDEMYDLARAIAAYLHSQKPDIKTIAVGMDGRTHSPQIRDEVSRGLLDSGLDVLFVGVCPTPALYFATYTLPVDAGIMITASHNPKEYNGMKLVLNKEVVWGKKIQEIKKLFHARTRLESKVQGSYITQSIIDSYVSWLTDHFKHLQGMQLSAIIDCGNGAAGTVLPQIIEKMGWSNVQLLYSEVDGNYPNHEADPTVEKNMLDVKNMLASTHIEVGLGLDGDCDRMNPMTKAGFLVPGDQLLAVFAHQIIDMHPGAAIVFDIKSSQALIDVLEKIGAQPVISPSGHSIIKDYMKQHQGLIGGELSCHFFFHDRYFGYDDGIYAAMRLFEILVGQGKTLEQLLSIVPKKCSSREYRVACPDDKKNMVVQSVKELFAQRHDVQALTIDGVRAMMPYGWGLVRVSNTQPALTIRFESDTIKGLQNVKQDFYDALKPYFEPSWLANQLEM
jgi:phosphomannomutase/phosphoglucomutase